MSGRVGDLSPKQEEILKKFKENVKDIARPGHDDYEFLRWLRARAFDLKKSEKMYRDSMAWRKEFGADTILEWDPPEVLKKYYPGGYVGTCKQGYPIWIDTLGPVDLKGMFYSVKPLDIFKYKVYYMELLYQKRLPELSKKFGRRIDQAQLIFDMEGIGMKHLWKPALDMFCGIMSIYEANYPESLNNAFIVNAIDVFTSILSIFEANYPESLQICFVVNAPSIFPLMYNIAKPFLSEATRNKIRVLGTPVIFPIAYNLAKPFLSEDTKKKIRVMGGNWKDELLKHIDPDQLPVHWGGTMQGQDEYCSDKVCMGGPIPDTYYAKNQQNFVSMDNFSKATVSKGSSLQLDFQIKEESYVIRWQFLTEGMDIGFGLFKKTAEGKQKAGDMEELIPTERVNSHIIPEDGSFTCPSPGTYVVRFDNTYSYLNSKKISYLVEILEPDTTLCTKM